MGLRLLVAALALILTAISGWTQDRPSRLARPPSGPAMVLGAWKGALTCNDMVDTTFTLKVTPSEFQGRLSGDFRFDVPDQPGRYGRYVMDGFAREPAFSLSGRDWVDHPESWQRMLGLTGAVHPDGNVIEGTVIGCRNSSFTARRTAAAPAPAAAASAPAAVAATPLGEWQGTYTCSQITNNAFDLSIKDAPAGTVAATFRFDVPGKPNTSGRYALIGNRPTPGAPLVLAPSAWLDKPEGFSAVGVSGQVSADGLTFTGTLPGCGTSSFKAFRRDGNGDAGANRRAAMTADGGPAKPLPQDFGGRIAKAASLLDQCQVLADWATPVTSLPNVNRRPFNSLQPEIVPLFEDGTFVPVFGMRYGLTTPEQRRAIWPLLTGVCESKFGAGFRGFVVSSPWQPQAEGSLAFAAVTAALLDRADAKAQIEQATARLAKLDGGDAPAELGQIETKTRPALDKLTEAERTDFRKVLDARRELVVLAALKSRIDAVDGLPVTGASLDRIKALSSDLARSKLPASELADARARLQTKAQAIVQDQIMSLTARAAQTQPTLASLADLTAGLRQMRELASGSDIGLKRIEVDQALAPVVNARRELLANPAVAEQFARSVATAAASNGSDDVGESRKAIDAASGRYLDPGDVAPAFRDAQVAALRTAQVARIAAILGNQADEAPPASGEPTSREMLSAVMQVSTAVNGGQDDLAGRCARREFQGNPVLAIMCLGQAGAGGPMHVRVDGFRKVACNAGGAPGYLCDYRIALRVTGGNSAMLAPLNNAGGNCTGRFVRTGDGWLLRERDCN